MVPGSEQRFAQTDGYEPQRSNVLRMLGYYSLLGLLRVHCLVGDYHGALKALAPMNPFKRKNLLTPRIAGGPASHHICLGLAGSSIVNMTFCLMVVWTHGRFMWKQQKSSDLQCCL